MASTDRLLGNGLMLLFMRLWICVVFGLSPQRVSMAADDHRTVSLRTHVSNAGIDAAKCGLSQQPCRTLAAALAMTGIGGTIVVSLDGDDSGDRWDWLCASEPLLITHSVTIEGADRLNRLGCPFPGPRMMLLNVSTGSAQIQATGNATVFTMVNVHLTGCVIYTSNARIHITRSVVEDTRISSMATSSLAEVTATDSEFLGTVNDVCVVGCGTSTELDLIGFVVRVQLTNTTFRHSQCLANASSVLDITVTGCTFTAVDSAKNSFLGGLSLTVRNKDQPSRVTVKDTTFENLLHNDPVQSVMNLLDAALLVRVTISKGGPVSNVTADSHVTVVVDGSHFGYGERGMTLIGPFRYVNISNSRFYENVAMHAGAGVLFLMDVTSRSYVVNCSFDTNAGGSFRPEQLKNHIQSFQVNQDEVHVNSNCCKGIIAFVGKGGAVRIQKGFVTLTSCRFHNNTARLLGGAVFVDRGSYLNINQVSFENSVVDFHSLEGDLIYSNGNVYINEARFVTVTASNHVAVVCHSGDHWSIDVASVFVQCPVGYRLRVTNSSAYLVSPIGLMRSYRMDQLSYFCESCPRNKYSLDHGFLNYSIVSTAVSYHTLLVNGQRPQQEFSGSHEHHDIVCLQCPYGGKCQQGISALPNFWGYISNQSVRFQRCPGRYCCSSSECKGFDRCARHRAGTLCGHCKSGYSEALFSPDCVMDSECDPTWLFPVMLSSGVIYFLFLLYQKDIRYLMFQNNDVIREFYCSCRRPRHKRLVDKNGDQKCFEGSAATFDRSTELQTFGFLRRSDFSEVAIRLSLGERFHTRYSGGPSSAEPADGLLCYDDDAQPSLSSSSAAALPSAASDSGAAPPSGPAPPPTDSNASFLIIVFFYFQDAQLLHINTALSSRENKAISMFKEILSGLFKFRIEFFQFIDKMCFLQGLNATTKLLIRALLVPYVLLQFGLVCLIYNWCSWTRNARGSKHRSSAGQQGSSSAAAASPKFEISLTTGFVLALLFTYQKLATTSLTLLNCVPVDGKRVLFIDGNIECYQVWQYPVIVYTMTCIVPFCLVLLIGPGLLKDGFVSLTQFFVATIIPFPFLIYWLWIRLVRRPKRPPQNPALTPASLAMLQILQGPFKDSELPFLGPICGQGILIGRRLVLVLLFTFVNDTLIRTLCMMLLCFIILLHHAHALPYKDRRGNLAGTASAAALVVVVGINLVRAAFEAAEYVPHGPNETLMKVFDEMENTLMLWVPGAVMGFVILSLSVKVVLLTIKNISTYCGGRGDTTRTAGTA